MNERMKILELLQGGKITTEQADLLISALEEGKKDTVGSMFRFDKKSLSELRNLGSQVSAAVTTSLNEAKRNLEQQFGDWSFQAPASVTVSTEIALPDAIESLSVETRNGRIQVALWDQPHALIRVRGQVRHSTDLRAAQQLLEQAIQSTQTDHLHQMSVLHGREVVGASIDLSIPRGLQRLFVKTHNGSIQMDGPDIEELQADTTNGSVLVYRASAQRLRISTHNGSIHVQSSLSSQCRSVYAVTHNGTIDIDGMAEDTYCVGTAKCQGGKLDVSGENLTVEYSDGSRRRSARFQHTVKPSPDTPETHIYCESQNGLVSIQS